MTNPLPHVEDVKAKELTRHVAFTPGFDKRNADPKKDYGINGGRFFFVVSGERGAVHFSFFAHFYPPSAEAHLVNVYSDGRMNQFGPEFQGLAGLARSFRPMGADVGYHAHEPQYDEQDIAQAECEWLGGRPCYSDGSALRASDWMAVFIERGTEWLWPELEAEYAARFYPSGQRP